MTALRPYCVFGVLSVFWAVFTPKYTYPLPVVFSATRARGKTLYCIQDTAAAAQNIHLAAYSLGLGTCWVGAFDEDEAKRILRIPDGVRPVALIPVGYPAEALMTRSRRPADEIVHNEIF